MYPGGFMTLPISIIAGLGIAAYYYLFVHRRNQQANSIPVSCVPPTQLHECFNDECGICKESHGRGPFIHLPCKHKLHYLCLIECVKNEIMRCPFCRKDITLFCKAVLPE